MSIAENEMDIDPSRATIAAAGKQTGLSDLDREAFQIATKALDEVEKQETAYRSLLATQAKAAQGASDTIFHNVKRAEAAEARNARLAAVARAAREMLPLARVGGVTCEEAERVLAQLQDGDT